MIESMAAGTPVIALRRGSVPEILIDGVTGYICDTVEDMKTPSPTWKAAAMASGVAIMRW